jgi:hypothetical protein
VQVEVFTFSQGMAVNGAAKVNWIINEIPRFA